MQGPVEEVRLVSAEKLALTLLSELENQPWRFRTVDVDGQRDVTTTILVVSRIQSDLESLGCYFGCGDQDAFHLAEDTSQLEAEGTKGKPLMGSDFVASMESLVLSDQEGFVLKLLSSIAEPFHCEQVPAVFAPESEAIVLADVVGKLGERPVSQHRPERYQLWVHAAFGQTEEFGRWIRAQPLLFL